MRRLLRLVLLAALTVWAWRFLAARRATHERVGVSYADGSSLVLEPGSTGFERLAAVARGALLP
ncbi:MAG: hypothetical protein E6G20_07310 [Actinobacteria bacterium]|nr:MAG: hypothetical protein E6G28_13065 [Actinomycetota bacterium]TML47793.1 MAG: hypothetical protein E6G20_07310 [Actinomycetota bacterium]